MKPRGLLMIEHRLIERMIFLIDHEIKKIKNHTIPDIQFINVAIDFIKTYADRTHHGKEEDILFRDCAKKSMSEEDTRIMKELVEEHKYGRKKVGELIEAKEKYNQGDIAQQTVIINKLESLAKFYPEHIKKEDEIFFPNAENYFTKEELDALLNEFRTFDQNMIHEKYKTVVEYCEKSQ